MHFDPIRLLTANAAAQVLASCLLGVAMLIPMQPWARALRPKLHAKSLLSAHLDWLMLAFMQWGAVLTMTHWPQARSELVALLLVFGGWVNALPYLIRGAGVDAFAFAGGLKQRLAAGLSGISSLALIVAWAMVVFQLVTAPAA